MNSAPSLQSRIYAGWLGKSIGGTLGLPAEGCPDRLSFTFYDPVPETAPPNDDLELQLVWLHLLETQGLDLTQHHFAEAWLRHIHYACDEYGRCRWNLRRGVPLSEAGTFENPFHAGMGSPIRSEIWAGLCAGKPELAARYAALDASLDHGVEGIAGEVFLAVMQNLVVGGVPLKEALPRALDGIPAASETTEGIACVMNLHAAGTETWRCREKLLEKHGNENFTHAPLNVALVVWALLYGEGDFEKSILLAVNGGYDTDCTAATTGATLGFMLGEAGIPERWRKPIGEEIFVGNGIQNLTVPRTLAELTERIMQLRRQLEARTEPPLVLPKPTGRVSLDQLPGTVTVHPKDHCESIPWANGELPVEIKRAGGGAWLWETGAGVNQPHFLICLAKPGARLWVDERLAVDCPPGLPYVPATHRCPSASRVGFVPTNPQHRIRLELGSREENQSATVLLAAANLHLASWTNGVLPHAPRLPAIPIDGEPWKPKPSTG